MNESLNPTWDQTFDFVVEDGLHDMIILEVWDHDTFGKVHFFLIWLYMYKLITFFGVIEYCFEHLRTIWEGAY